MPKIRVEGRTLMDILFPGSDAGGPGIGSGGREGQPISGGAVGGEGGLGSRGGDDAVQLEWRLVYALVVAGKSARFANASIAALRRQVGDVPPIAYIARTVAAERLPGVRDALEIARTGRYRVLRAALAALAAAEFDLRTVSPGELEAVPGIGPKTARFFVAWTRPDARVAVLDRHVLRWLAAEGYADVPTSTPSGRAYVTWEQVFLFEADRRGKTPRELDLEIWGAAATAPNSIGDEI